MLDQTSDNNKWIVKKFLLRPNVLYDGGIALLFCDIKINLS